MMQHLLLEAEWRRLLVEWRNIKSSILINLKNLHVMERKKHPDHTLIWIYATNVIFSTFPKSNNLCIVADFCVGHRLLKIPLHTTDIWNSRVHNSGSARRSHRSSGGRPETISITRRGGERRGCWLGYVRTSKRTRRIPACSRRPLSDPAVGSELLERPAGSSQRATLSTRFHVRNPEPSTSQATEEYAARPPGVLPQRLLSHHCPQVFRRIPPSIPRIAPNGQWQRARLPRSRWGTGCCGPSTATAM